MLTNMSVADGFNNQLSEFIVPILTSKILGIELLLLAAF